MKLIVMLLLLLAGCVVVAVIRKAGGAPSCLRVGRMETTTCKTSQDDGGVTSPKTMLWKRCFDRKRGDRELRNRTKHASIRPRDQGQKSIPLSGKRHNCAATQDLALRSSLRACTGGGK